MDISQESRALICTLLKESSEKDRELHLSMYGKAAQLQKQMDAKSAWFQEKYSGLIHGGRRLPVPRCNTRAHCATHHCGDWRGSFLEEVAFVRRSFQVLAVTSSGLSSDASDAGLPSESTEVIGLPERLASQVFSEWSVLWRLPVPGSCQLWRCGRIRRWKWMDVMEAKHDGLSKSGDLKAHLDMANPEHKSLGALSPIPETNAMAVDGLLASHITVA
ncbi:hypothetical protein Tco_0729976 [Tanacetum coccineum]|uniref:Uncharacterized protein n=1 Tax=Tanacetum coccineum TaxID=301880 RepID=A0ABQ4YSX0_9ASTR